MEELEAIYGSKIKTITIILENGEETEQCLIKEHKSGLIFCVDAKYMEQSAEKIHSPYGHGLFEF